MLGLAGCQGDKQCLSSLFGQRLFLGFLCFIRGEVGGPTGWFLNWNRMSRWCPRLWKTPFHQPCQWREMA